MKLPRYTKLVTSLDANVPFVSPDTLERLRGRAYSARLGANENGFGPSPKAVEAMSAAARDDIWKYGDELSWNLREKLAEKHGVTVDNIIVGEGIDGLLGLLCRLLVEPGVDVVTTLGGYPTFNYHVNAFGGRLHCVPFANDHEDLDGLAEMARQTNASVVYLANPDNPMGTWHEGDKIKEFAGRLPDECLLCLDEAYIEFAPDGTAPEFDASDDRVIRFRTFSKAYGMAGARIGYGIAAPGLIGAFNKVRNHFGVNLLAQVGAMAALDDEAWLNDMLGKVFAARKRLAEIARQNGLSCLPSATNFVAIDTGRDGDYARAVAKFCGDLDVFVRTPFAPPQDRCLRVSVGPAEEIELFGAALGKALSSI